MSIFAAAFADGALGLLAQQSDPGWFEMLVKSHHFDEIVVFSFISLMVAIPVVSGIWYKLRVKEWETALKQTMLDRGMSVDEICRVLDAGSGIAGMGCRKPRPESHIQPARSMS